MTTPIAPIRNIRYPLAESFVVLDPAREFLFPELVVFYLEGASLDGKNLSGLRLSFALEDQGRTLVFLGSDDTMYFAQFDRMKWIDTAAKAIVSGAAAGMPVYIEGQLSGRPKGMLLSAVALLAQYPTLAPSPEASLNTHPSKPQRREPSVMIATAQI